MYVRCGKLGCAILCCFEICVFPKTRGSAILQIWSGQDKKSLQWQLWSGRAVAKIQTVCFSFLIFSSTINLLEKQIPSAWVRHRLTFPPLHARITNSMGEGVSPTRNQGPEDVGPLAFKSLNIFLINLVFSCQTFIHIQFLSSWKIISKTYSQRIDIKGGSGCPYIGAARLTSLIILTFVGTAAC